jgi:hypothetical protein
MSSFRFGRWTSWLALAAVGMIGVLYFRDPTRRAALTQTAGWFLTAARIVLGR